MNSFKYLYTESLPGNQSFCVAENFEELILFIHEDKHGYYNVFVSIADYADYLKGDSTANRIVFANKPAEDNQGVDSLDEFLATKSVRNAWD